MQNYADGSTAAKGDKERIAELEGQVKTLRDALVKIYEMPEDSFFYADNIGSISTKALAAVPEPK